MLNRIIYSFGITFNKKRHAGYAFPNKPLQTPFNNWKIALGDTV